MSYSLSSRPSSWEAIKQTGSIILSVLTDNMFATSNCNICWCLVLECCCNHFHTWALNWFMNIYIKVVILWILHVNHWYRCQSRLWHILSKHITSIGCFNTLSYNTITRCTGSHIFLTNAINLTGSKRLCFDSSITSEPHQSLLIL
jgi:hypothetical protein